VFGILGLFTGIAALPAVICGHTALTKINAAEGRLKGKGLAIAGLIMGYFMVAAFIVAGIVSLAKQ
jgi:hypothetical protein